MKFPEINHTNCFICKSKYIQANHNVLEEYFCNQCNVAYVVDNYRNLRDFVAFYFHDNIEFILKDNMAGGTIYEGEACDPPLFNLKDCYDWNEVFIRINEAMARINKIRVFK